MVEMLPPAEAEMIEAAEWYEQKVPGLGKRFLLAIEAAGVAIVETPLSGAPYFEVRRRVLQDFPYSIIYVTEPNLLIVAVAHMQRNPVYWLDRI